ncbi:hypothetical protein [Paraburkholderia pallida]|uniref:Uncharacterized protein n=1 Tax=Paraburkholderia pallida TaxID=2547399 RepID=A0A4P7D816_9BURK|nr:hypothetical protein [Paraburkholderia pallida]QBR04338.1 hypothetical protein E1956_45370 [Paraburkholderia pallida]
MNTLTINDLEESGELDHQEMSNILGGRMKIIGQPAGSLLTSPDGDPVGVYVDGMLQNSVTDGYYHG